MSNSAPESEEKPVKSKWGVVQWAILGGELGAICALITVIVFSLLVPSITMLPGNTLFWIYFLILSFWILPIGIVITLCGMIGGFIIDRFLRSAKNHISAKIGGFMAGFSLLCVLTVAFFPHWPDPACNMLYGATFYAEDDMPAFSGGRMHPSVSFDAPPFIFLDGFIYFSSGDTIDQELYKCKNGQVTVYYMTSYSYPDGKQSTGRYDLLTDTFEWNGGKYTRGYKK